MLDDDVVTEAGRPRLAQDRDLIAALETAEVSTDLSTALLEARRVQVVADTLGRIDIAQWAEITALDALARTEGARNAVVRGSRILEWATEQGDTRLASRCHALLAMMDTLAGLPGSGAEHATTAVTLLDGTESPRLRVKLLTRQAIGLFAAGMLQCGFDVSRRALVLAEQLDDHELQAQLASNAFHAAMDEHLLDEAGRWTETIDGIIAAAPEFESELSDVLIRGHVAAGQPQEALAVLERHGLDVTPDSQPELRAGRKLLLAQIHHGLGDLHRAVTALDEAEDLAILHQLDDLATWVIEERATIAAAAGDFRLAYELHRTFHRSAHERWLEAQRSQVDHLLAEQSLTEAIVRAEQAEAAVAVDPLTKVRNRRWVEDSLPDVVRSWQAGGACTGSLAILDLDHFKQVNDRFGHAAGDDVLVAVAECLQECHGVRDVARIGGEEFLLVLKQHADQQDVAVSVLSAVRGLQWPHIHPGLRLTASIGFACYVPGTTSADLLRDADRNLYRAKRAGRDRAMGPW